MFLSDLGIGLNELERALSFSVSWGTLYIGAICYFKASRHILSCVRVLSVNSLSFMDVGLLRLFFFSRVSFCSHLPRIYSTPSESSKIWHKAFPNTPLYSKYSCHGHCSTGLFPAHS
jgi:hypothetical protein